MGYFLPGGLFASSCSGRTVTAELRFPCKLLFFHVSVKSLKYKRINTLSLHVTDVGEFFISNITDAEKRINRRPESSNKQIWNFQQMKWYSQRCSFTTL